MKKKRASKTARRPASRKVRIKKQRRKPAVLRRTLSQINYEHWWRQHPCWNEVHALCLDEQKAAVFYEAYRRCPSLQDAWLKGIRGPKAMTDFGWQMFTATVLDHLLQTWIQLPLSLRKAIIIQQLPKMLPPVGYSVWPSEPFFFDPQAIPPKDDFETQEEYDEHWRPETPKQFHQRCRNFAATVIMIPPEDDALHLLKDLKRLVDDGFVLVAIDSRSREAFNYAIQFLERRLKRSRSYRAADLYWNWPKTAGPIPAEEGLFEDKSILAEWQAIGKRVKRSKGGDVVLESNVFKFQELCKGLESYDKTGTPSDLMKRLRSGLKG